MHLSRLSTLLLAATLGFGAASARAVDVPVVTVQLDGKTVGPGLTTNVSSGATHILAAPNYTYRIEGSIHGSGGALQFLVPNGTKISDFVKMIQNGAESTLTGKYVNPGSKLPFTVINKTYHGTVTYAGFPITANLTIKGTVTAVGQVHFIATNVSVTGSPIAVGNLVFENDAQLVVGVSPVFQLNKVVQTVSEAAGTVTVDVKRAKNVSGAVSVKYATQFGTAKAADFDATSGTLNFAANETLKSFTVNIKNNTAKDGSRKFTVKLLQPSAGCVIGARKVETITITNDD